MRELSGFSVGPRFRQGAMAELWHVTAAGGGTSLLKRPRVGFGDHPACYAGFQTERIILGRLAGPHAPRLLAEGEDGDGPWLIVEEIAGPSLAEAIARTPLPAGEVARLGAAIATALHALHRQEVVHHDLTPAHLLFRPDGEAVLIDFGLARHGQLPDLVETESDHPLGTPAYISPEQLAGVRGDPRSDVFALGVILYQLACGRLPFGAPTTVAGMKRRLYLDPAAPRALRPEVPEWLQETILRCLAVRTDNRYASAALVAHDLTHPEQVAVGELGRRLAGTPWRKLLRRAWQAHFVPPTPAPPPSRVLARAPHVLAAVDTGSTHEALAQALRDAVRRLIAAGGQWRVTCATVLDTLPGGSGDDLSDLARTLRTQRLMELHHWAEPLELPPERLRFAVLEDTDTASALVAYARTHQVDHIVMGARGSSALRRLLGSVSARVVAEAPCTVTVARRPTLSEESSR